MLLVHLDSAATATATAAAETSNSLTFDALLAAQHQALRIGACTFAVVEAINDTSESIPHIWASILDQRFQNVGAFRGSEVPAERRQLLQELRFQLYALFVHINATASPSQFGRCRQRAPCGFYL
jgi:hypothetical protein